MAPRSTPKSQTHEAHPLLGGSLLLRSCPRHTAHPVDRHGHRLRPTGDAGRGDVLQAELLAAGGGSRAHQRRSVNVGCGLRALPRIQPAISPSSRPPDPPTARQCADGSIQMARLPCPPLALFLPCLDGCARAPQARITIGFVNMRRMSCTSARRIVHTHKMAHTYKISGRRPRLNV